MVGKGVKWLHSDIKNMACHNVYPVSEAVDEVVLPEMRHVGCIFINRAPQSR